MAWLVLATLAHNLQRWVAILGLGERRITQHGTIRNRFLAFQTANDDADRQGEKPTQVAMAAADRHGEQRYPGREDAQGVEHRASVLERPGFGSLRPAAPQGAKPNRR